MPRPTRPEIHIQRLLSGQHGDVPAKAFLDYAKFADAQLNELRGLVREHRTDPRFRSEYSLPSDEQLAKYESDIEALRARAEPVKAPPPQTAPSSAPSEHVAASSAGPAAAPMKTLPVEAEQSTTVRHRRARPVRSATGRSEGNNRNEGDSLSTEEVLAKEEKRREELAAEMVALAGTLKTGAKRTHAALVQERPALDKLATQTETSIEAVQRQTSRIRAQLGRSWSFTLCLWALVCVTMMLFLWTYFFMRTFRKR